MFDLNKFPFFFSFHPINAINISVTKSRKKKTTVWIMKEEKNYRSLSGVKTFIAFEHIESCISFTDSAFNAHSLRFRSRITLFLESVQIFTEFFSLSLSLLLIQLKHFFLMTFAGCGKIPDWTECCEWQFRCKYFTTFDRSCMRKLCKRS